MRGLCKKHEQESQRTEEIKQIKDKEDTKKNGIPAQ